MLQRAAVLAWQGPPMTAGCCPSCVSATTCLCNPMMSLQVCVRAAADGLCRPVSEQTACNACDMPCVYTQAAVFRLLANWFVVHMCIFPLQSPVPAPSIQILEGPAVTEVRQVYKGLGSLVTRLWKGKPGLEVEWSVGPPPTKVHWEMFVRHSSSIASGGCRQGWGGGAVGGPWMQYIAAKVHSDSCMEGLGSLGHKVVEGQGRPGGGVVCGAFTYQGSLGDICAVQQQHCLRWVPPGSWQGMRAWMQCSAVT